MSTRNGRPRVDWKARDREIIRRTDVRAEAERLGVRFAARPPSGDWHACHAVGRDDADPSATLNCGDGHARGTYRNHGGDGGTLSFFDLAARLGEWPDWRAARDHYARQASVDGADGPGKPRTAPRGDHPPRNPAFAGGDEGSNAGASANDLATRNQTPPIDPKAEAAVSAVARSFGRPPDHRWTYRDADGARQGWCCGGSGRAAGRTCGKRPAAVTAGR